MPQLMLPVFPKETEYINEHIGFIQRDGKVWYFNGAMPIFHHDVRDLSSFKMFVSQLYIMGNVKQAEIVRAFGITKEAIRRWVKKYREQGAESFFAKPTGRGPTVLTPEKLEEIQKYIDSGLATGDIAEIVDVKKDTILKAIQSKKLKKKTARA